MKAYGNPGWGRDTRNEQSLQDVAFVTRKKYDGRDGRRNNGAKGKRVRIDGVEYASIEDAAAATGIPRASIRVVIKHKIEAID